MIEFKLLLFILLNLLTINSYSQSSKESEHWIHWAHNTKTDGHSYALDVAADKSGNLYQIGYVEDSIWLPQEEKYHDSDSVADIYIEKLDADGNPLWVKILSRGDSTPYFQMHVQIDVLPNGNFVVAGTALHPIDLDPGPDVASLWALRTWTMFVSVYTPNGTYLWHRRASTNGNDQIRLQNLVVTDDNEIICSGLFGNTAFFFQANNTWDRIEGSGASQSFICRLSTYGDFETVLAFSGSLAMSISDIAVNSLGDIYLCGVFIGNMDLDPGSGEYLIQSSTSFTDVFLIRLDRNGKFLWGGQIDGPSEQVGTSVTIDENDNSYWAGYIFGTSDIDPSSATDYFSGSSSRDGFLIRMNSNNQYLMGRSYPLASATSMISIEAGNNGKVYLLGSTTKRLTYSTGATGPPNKYVIEPNGKFAFYTVTVDSIGDPYEIHTIISDFSHQLHDICIDQNENIILPGSSGNIIEIDSLQINRSFTNPRPGSLTPLILKFNSSSALGTATLATCDSYVDERGIEYIDNSSAVITRIPREGIRDSFVRINVVVQPFSRFHQPVAFPNPNTGKFNISNYTFGATLSLYNSMGQLIMEEQVLREPHLIDLDLNSGVYYLVVHSACGTYTEKVAVR